MVRTKHKSKSTLDYIICSPEIEVSEIDEYHLDRFPNNSSTHSPILATVTMNKNIQTATQK